MNQIDILVEMLSRAYEYIFELGAHRGHWGDVRKTSMAGLCLSFREPRNSPWLLHIRKWLLNQQQRQDGRSHWNAQLWDTAVALIALRALGASYEDDSCRESVQWILDRFNQNGRYNWNDEPWETTFCSLALLANDSLDLKDTIVQTVSQAAGWLMDLQDQHGRIVSPTYTGLSLLVFKRLGEIKDSPALHAAREKASRYLLDTFREDILWAGEPRMNGLVVWGLLYGAERTEALNHLSSRIVQWYLATQQPSGGWGEYEDTLYPTVGLYNVLLYLMDDDDAQIQAYNILRRYLDTPPLQLRRKIIETYSDGTISINITPTLKKVLILLFTAASVISAILSYLNAILNFLGLR